MSTSQNISHLLVSGRESWKLLLMPLVTIQVDDPSSRVVSTFLMGLVPAVDYRNILRMY